MSEFFVVSVRSASLMAALRGYPERLIQKVTSAVSRMSLEIQTAVKETKLTGQVLKARTGTLRRSINRQMKVTGSSVVATVGTNVEYAAIHEYGGVVRGHIVEARRGKALRFTPKGSSEAIFRRRVNIPDVNMPERSFLRSTLREFSDRVQAAINRAAGEALS